MRRDFPFRNLGRHSNISQLLPYQLICQPHRFWEHTATSGGVALQNINIDNPVGRNQVRCKSSLEATRASLTSIITTTTTTNYNTEYITSNKNLSKPNSDLMTHLCDIAITNFIFVKLFFSVHYYLVVTN